MGDLIDKLRERAERAERERDTLRAEVERLRADRDAAEARGYRRGLEAAARECEAVRGAVTGHAPGDEYKRGHAEGAADCVDAVRALAPEAAPEQSAACPCEGDDEEPGPHLPSCPWADPDYVPPGDDGPHAEVRRFTPESVAAGLALLEPAEQPAERRVRVGSPEHVALWDAINAFAVASGGRADAINGARMDAVVRVEHALAALVTAAPEHPAEALTDEQIREWGREWSPEQSAERPIAVGERVRVVRCCNRECSCYGLRPGAEGALLSYDPDAHPDWRYVVAVDGARRVVAAVERVEPAREEPAHAGHSIGDEWRHEDGREARVTATSTGLCGCLTLSLRVPGDRGPAAGRGTQEALEREGWRRVRCAEEVGRDE